MVGFEEIGYTHYIDLSFIPEQLGAVRAVGKTFALVDPCRSPRAALRG